MDQSDAWGFEVVMGESIRHFGSLPTKQDGTDTDVKNMTIEITGTCKTEDDDGPEKC